MDDKVKIRPPGLYQVFREKAHKVRDGVQLNYPELLQTADAQPGLRNLSA